MSGNSSELPGYPSDPNNLDTARAMVRIGEDTIRDLTQKHELSPEEVRAVRAGAAMALAFNTLPVDEPINVKGALFRDMKKAHDVLPGDDLENYVNSAAMRDEGLARLSEIAPPDPANLRSTDPPPSV